MELKLQEYKQTDFDACMDLFDSNCPAYFAIEERIDYQNYLKFNEDKYLLGYIWLLLQITARVKSLKSKQFKSCLLYTSPSPRDRTRSRMPSSA